MMVIGVFIAFALAGLNLAIGQPINIFAGIFCFGGGIFCLITSSVFWIKRN